VRNAAEALPTELAAAHAMILAERAARIAAEAEVERLKLLLALARREQYGQSSERGRRLVEQLELQLEELDETVAAAHAAAELAAPAVEVRGFQRRLPARRPLPENLPRRRIVYPAPEACPGCGGGLRKLGEDVTESLERIPAQWLVIQHVREKFTCRSCETITQPPAPAHPIARGRAGPNLLAEVAFAKFGLHLPLHRQSARFAAEGVGLDVSTLADWIGATAVALEPLLAAIKAHVLAAERIHADDTTVPVLAKDKCRTGRLWAVVRDDRPFAGPAAPAAVYFYSRDRSGAHPQAFLAGYAGIMQADAYSGFGQLYDGARTPGPIVEAACWAHGRRKLYDIADLKRAPIAIEAVRRIDGVFAIEREINGRTAHDRVAERRERVRPLIDALETFLREKRAALSAKSELAKAIDYLLKRWPAFTRFLDDGRICLTNNAAERALRGIAIGRHNWTFAGSDEGGRRAAAMYTLIETAKLNDVDPRAWLADVLQRLGDHPAKHLHELLPWNWKARGPPQ
jgi:transposase